MREAPMVSVVIPTYNRASMIARAVRSILTQTFEDWELIVVDDASTDNTEAVVSSFTDPRIRYRKHQVNRGGSAARNTGIRNARGEYVAFLDSDDEWLPNKLELQVEAFEDSDGDIGLIYTGLINQYRNEESIELVPKYRGNLRRNLLIQNVVGSTSTPMIRKDVLVSVGGFDPRFPARQDLDLWVRIAKKCTIDFISSPFVIIHKERGDRISRSGEARCWGYLLFFKKHKEDLRKAGLEPLYLSKMGREFELQSGKKEVARLFYRKAITEKTTYLLPYMRLVATYLPEQGQSLLKELYNTFKA